VGSPGYLLLLAGISTHRYRSMSSDTFAGLQWIGIVGLEMHLTCYWVVPRTTRSQLVLSENNRPIQSEIATKPLWGIASQL
jgi:hypothetical protein